jgi:hypothetical protein
MLETIKFIRDQWFGFLVIAVLVFMQINSSMEMQLYKEQIKKLEKQVEHYQNIDELNKKKIDSLSSLEQEVITQIETIKEKEYVQIKVVDSLPISKLQQFFTERYNN